MADLDELFRSVAGPPATADLEAIEARAGRHRRARLAAMGATVVVVVLAAAGVLLALGEAPGEDVVAGPDPAPVGCEPPAASDERVPDEDAAVRVAERFVAARSAGEGAPGCLGEDALGRYERAERFEGPHGEQAVACLYFDACPDGDRIVDGAVVGVSSTVYGQHTGRVVQVQLRYRRAGVVNESLTVANTTRPDGTRVVLVVDMGLSPGAMVNDAEAEQLVMGFLDALSAGHWELAAAFFTNPAVGFGDPGVDWGEDIDWLLAAEPELAAQHDVAGLLAAWCEDHSGACLPVAEITGNTPLHGISREVTVRLRHPDGNIAVFADGSDQATFGVGWFEGVTWIADIPPRLAE